MADTGQNIEIFLEVLRQILPSLKNQPDGQLSRRIGKEKLEDAAADVAGFIETGSNTALSKNERLALSSRVLNCLAEHIKSMDTPVTLNTMITHIQLIQHATEQSFPGYSESKLLKYTIAPLKSSEVLPLRR